MRLLKLINYGAHKQGQHPYDVDVILYKYELNLVTEKKIVNIFTQWYEDERDIYDWYIEHIDCIKGDVFLQFLSFLPREECLMASMANYIDPLPDDEVWGDEINNNLDAIGYYRTRHDLSLSFRGTDFPQCLVGKNYEGKLQVSWRNNDEIRCEYIDDFLLEGFSGSVKDTAS